MTRRRWIADQFDNERAVLLGANAAHLARVLRARAGQEYDLVCGSRLRLGTILSATAERVEFALRELPEYEAMQPIVDLAHAATPQREILLLVAIYKFDRMEWAIEKCTELGVTRIVPVVARRTDSHLALAAAKRVERWRRVAHEAAQQSRRMAAPQIDEPMKLKAALALDTTSSAEVKLLLNENERSEKLSAALTAATGAVAFAVGPEGGWTQDEVAQFESAGWKSVTLGSTVLRAETAAIAAVAAMVAILG